MASGNGATRTQMDVAKKGFFVRRRPHCATKYKLSPLEGSAQPLQQRQQLWPPADNSEAPTRGAICSSGSTIPRYPLPLRPLGSRSSSSGSSGSSRLANSHRPSVRFALTDCSAERATAAPPVTAAAANRSNSSSKEVRRATPWVKGPQAEAGVQGIGVPV